MMIWLRWIELYCHALAEITQGPRGPGRTAEVIDLSAERAKRRRAAMRAS